MIRFYYALAMVNAALSLTTSVVVFWKNRYQLVGPLFGLTMLVFAVWLVGWAHYFQPLNEPTALAWAQVTVSAAILVSPVWFHTLCEMAERTARFQRWIVAAYATAGFFLILLWSGHLITGLAQAPYMAHYIRFNRVWNPVLIVVLTAWPWFGFGVALSRARTEPGYKRTQLVYFLVAWLVIFLVTYSIIVPMELGVHIQPFGFFILPVDLMFLTYATARARLADFNIVAARVLLVSVTLMIVVGVSLLFVSVATLWYPGFLNQAQTLFTIGLALAIGIGLVVTLPKLLPRAERIMQERMFGKRYGYQDALGGVVKELSLLSNVEEVLRQVTTTIHSEMQLTRVLVLLQDALTGEYQMQAESGFSVQETGDLALAENSPIIRWLRQNKDQLVRDEIVRRLPPQTVRELNNEMDRLKVSVCVPMFLDARLTGLIGLGEKTNHDMFHVSDLRVLENLATEVALAVKYRRMEDQISRKNKLIELGTIAAGVAHEIRNPLASIRTFAQLMPDRMDDPEFKNEFSKLVVKDVDRITRVVESMLAFARPAQVQIAEHSASDLVEEAVLLVQARLKSKRIELTRQFHERPVLRVDKQQILQVLVNLLSNATDALPELGKIRVATGVRTMEDAQEGNGNQRYGVIEVADNGPGIPAAVRNRLFDPFFTTKKEGTGLGLSISQKIVRDHGGIITVSSIEGKGTTFQINLPLN